MLDFAIIAVTVVVGLLITVLYLYQRRPSKPTTVPGLDPTTEEDGNLADISRAGSLHEFLLDLHGKFGGIASFWMGKRYVVSIATPELFRQHIGVFDRPPELFNLFKPMFGTKSITYANGAEGKARRHMYDKAMTHDSIKKYFVHFQEVADGVAKKWETRVKEEHIPLSEHMMEFALKSVLIALFGKTMKDDIVVQEIRKEYDHCWEEMERSLTEPMDATREKHFYSALRSLKELLTKSVKDRKENPPKHGEELEIDLIFDYSDDTDLQTSDVITYTVGGFHTTGFVLTWAFYFLASDPDVQEKVYKEIKENIGDEDVDHTSMGDLLYLRQVIDETLRCAVVGPWAARFRDSDSELGGHKIPRNTPVIHALGVMLQDDKYWPLPNKFDPDRFSPENCKKRPQMAFQPFGFAGKRICPGQKFALTEATVCMVTLLRKFKVNIVEGQVVTPVHGLVTHPKDEIWITIEKR